MAEPQPPPEFKVRVDQIDWDRYWGLFFLQLQQWMETAKSIPALGDLARAIEAHYRVASIETTLQGATELGRRLGLEVDRFEAGAGPTLAAAAAAALSDFFGTAVSANDVLGARAPSGARELADRLGRSVFNQLTEAFSTGGGLSPEAGRAAAERAVGLSIQTALESWIGTALSQFPIIQHLPNWADLDDLLSANLGLGRIVRRVMGPLLTALVVEPFRWDINRRFTPQLFSETQAVRARFHERISEAEYFETMARLGWSRERAADLQFILGRLPEKDDIARMVELGFADEKDAVRMFQMLGFAPAAAEAVAKVVLSDRVRTANTALESVARDMYRSREISRDEYQRLLRAADRTPAEVELLTGLGDIERSRPARLPRAVMEDAFRNDQVDLGRLRRYYEEEGFATDDVLLLLEVQLRRKARTREEEEARPAAALEAGFEELPRSVVEQAYVQGIIDLARLRQFYAARRFRAEDVDVLIELVSRRREEFQAGEVTRARS